MPSDPVSVLRDIEHQIDLAFQFVAGFDSAAFQNDTRTVYAVTRCLEISEASRRLPDELKARYPAIAWKNSLTSSRENPLITSRVNDA